MLKNISSLKIFLNKYWNLKSTKIVIYTYLVFLNNNYICVEKFIITKETNYVYKLKLCFIQYRCFLRYIVIKEAIGFKFVYFAVYGYKPLNCNSLCINVISFRLMLLNLLCSIYRIFNLTCFKIIQLTS